MNMDTLADRLRSFEAENYGHAPVIVPAGYYISLLSQTHLTDGMVNSGFLQSGFINNDTRYIISIGLARRCTNGTPMLRILAVEAQPLNNQHNKVGIVLQGDPSGSPFMRGDANPRQFIRSCLNETSPALINAQRILGGTFNLLRRTGILQPGDPVSLEAISKLFASGCSDVIFGQMLSDPIQGVMTLFRSLNKRPAIGDGSLNDRLYWDPLNSDPIHSSPGHKGDLNGMSLKEFLSVHELSHGHGRSAFLTVNRRDDLDGVVPSFGVRKQFIDMNAPISTCLGEIKFSDMITEFWTRRLFDPRELLHVKWELLHAYFDAYAGGTNRLFIPIGSTSVFLCVSDYIGDSRGGGIHRDDCICKSYTDWDLGPV